MAHLGVVRSLLLGCVMDGEPLQDALLVYYNGLARLSDVNVERQIDREAFDYRWFMLPRLPRISTKKRLSLVAGSDIKGDGHRPVTSSPEKDN